MAMECSTFTSELAELLAGPFDPDDPVRKVRLEALSRHARDCSACEGAAALVAVAAQAPEARSPAAEPGPEFWESFDRRLASRLDAERDRARRRARLRLVAAAWVLVALGLAAVWALRGSPVAPPRVAGAVEEPPRPKLPDEVSAEDAALADALADDDDLEVFSDESGSQARPELYPTFGELDGEARARLYRWLVEEEARLKTGRGGAA